MVEGRIGQVAARSKTGGFLKERFWGKSVPVSLCWTQKRKLKHSQERGPRT